MRRLTAVVVAAVLGVAARAEDPAAVVDKAAKAVGGADKLDKITAFTFTGKGQISAGGGEGDITVKATYQGIDHMRQDIEMSFGGMEIKGASVLAKDKGWRKFGDMGGALEGGELDNMKRITYLGAIPVLVTPLKGNGFKLAAGEDGKVDDKPAVSVKATGPEGKDFVLWFDKESGLPVKMVATVTGFMGEDVKQETTYGDYKEMGGIKKATKVESKRDGQKYMTLTVSDFKPLDKVDPKTFTAPE
jgi:hypothetical protein